MPATTVARAAFPSQQQLLLPLLGAIESLGGRARPRDLYDRVAADCGIPEAERGRVIDCAGRRYNAWERSVRWARQRAVLRGYVAGPGRDLWEITERGSAALRNIRAGAVVTVYESESGVALWAEAQAASGLIEDGSVQLILTSPPYPLLRRKAYAGQHPEAAHVEWLLDHARDWRRLLRPDGSLVLNTADAWRPGSPTLSLWQERLLLRLCDELGFHLAGKFAWHNPSKMPSPAEWVTVRRIRVTPAVENIFWLSPSEWPEADNRRVLRAYGRSMLGRIGAGGEAGADRPSGHRLARGAFGRDNGGSIPHNLITAANTASNDAYQRHCRAEAIPSHPARFPAALPEFFVRFLTREGDTVFDPFGGSLQTAAVAGALGRRWISSEKSLTYLRGALGGRLGAKANLGGGPSSAGRADEGHRADGGD